MPRRDAITLRVGIAEDKHAGAGGGRAIVERPKAAPQGRVVHRSIAGHLAMDVGVGDGQLTTEQCGWLKGMVEHQASGIVFMPGLQGRQFSLLDTALNELYPVVLDEAQRGGWGSRTPCRFELTELGRRSLLTKLAGLDKTPT